MARWATHRTDTKKHKYGAVRTEIDGHKFASKAEGRRYQELKLLEKAGEIHGLVLQPEWTLDAGVPSRTVGKYRGDFMYCCCPLPNRCGRTVLVVEDVKGFKTELYRWKAKHMAAQYDIEIQEIGRR